MGDVTLKPLTVVELLSELTVQYRHIEKQRLAYAEIEKQREAILEQINACDRSIRELSDEIHCKLHDRAKREAKADAVKADFAEAQGTDF